MGELQALATQPVGQAAWKPLQRTHSTPVPQTRLLDATQSVYAIFLAGTRAQPLRRTVEYKLVRERLVELINSTPNVRLAISLNLFGLCLWNEVHVPVLWWLLQAPCPAARTLLSTSPH